MTEKKQFRIGTILYGPGASWNAWMHPTTPNDASVNKEHYKNLISIAEKGKLDFAFVADALFITEDSMPHYLSRFEPLTLLSYLAAHTKNIGLVGTVSTSYSEPFNVARQFASLDLLSDGRAGWNAVTTALDGTASNFSKENHLEHSIRYERAEEFIQVAKGLWDSWEEDAFIRNDQTGEYFDPTKMHKLNHKGKYFSVAGPLNINGSKQKRPICFQAGSSPRGRQLAAKEADAIFINNVNVEECKEFYQDIKRRTLQEGREEDDVLVLLGMHPIVGKTVEEAQAKYDRLVTYIRIEDALKHLGSFYDHHDFSQYPLDEPFPQDIEVGREGFKGITSKLKKWALEENLTLRQLALQFATQKGDFFGTPEMVADAMEHWFNEKAVDGFMIGGWAQPEGLEDFVEHVLPILQERGLFRKEYETSTLRDNLRLKHPQNQYTKITVRG